MRITAGNLRKLIRETLYKARTPDGRETTVDAPNTMKAGNLAANEFGGGIDPFTIDLQPIDQQSAANDPSDQSNMLDFWVHLPSGGQYNVKGRLDKRFGWFGVKEISEDPQDGYTVTENDDVNELWAEIPRYVRYHAPDYEGNIDVVDEIGFGDGYERD